MDLQNLLLLQYSMKGGSISTQVMLFMAGYSQITRDNVGWQASFYKLLSSFPKSLNLSCIFNLS